MHDVAKVAQLPLSYCVSKDEWVASLLQHPIVGSFILPGYPEKSSVAPQFKGLNPFVVVFVGAYDSQTYIAIENTVALRNLSLRSLDKPLLFHMLSIFWVVVLAIANLRFISVVLWLLVLISDPR